MKEFKAGLVTLIAVGASAAVFLVVMVGAFWGLFVLPMVAFLILTVVFSVLSSGRPEKEHRQGFLLFTEGTAREGTTPFEPAGTSPSADTDALATEGGREKP